jgi:restriction endonuclease Mrr
MRPIEFEGEDRIYLVQLSLCLQCGWWKVYRVHQGENPRTRHMMEDYVGAIGCLKELDLDDISTPLEEVRQYLLAKNDALYRIHPKLFEDVVCSVFLDFGWKAHTTAYVGDDGVDVILEGASGSIVGVQVKRYRKDRRIEAEQIRSLAGALLVNKCTRGVFVTTSAFRRGAKRTASALATIGRPIELVDAERFLNAQCAGNCADQVG